LLIGPVVHGSPLTQQLPEEDITRVEMNLLHCSSAFRFGVSLAIPTVAPQWRLRARAGFPGAGPNSLRGWSWSSIGPVVNVAGGAGAGSGASFARASRLDTTALIDAST
jgi:hypothetical protein